jgi:SPP1 family predicted phage head-tail adaptor
MLGHLEFSRLDRRVTVQRRTLTQDGAGEAIESWTDDATVWAEARDPKGRELFQADQRAAQIDRVFVLRWRAINQKDYRILYENDVYDIEEIAEIGRQAGLQLRCKVHRDAN